jgi:hypothetical protein
MPKGQPAPVVQPAIPPRVRQGPRRTLEAELVEPRLAVRPLAATVQRARLGGEKVEQLFVGKARSGRLLRRGAPDGSARQRLFLGVD